jgi:hypothetical protein
MHKRISLFLLCLTLSTTFRGQAQSTIFTYQGRLAANGAPATGLFDIQFTIYKVLASGVPIAGPVTNLAVGVTNGLFITSLDFGNQPFLGVNRFLDIAVRTNGAAGGFTSLVPRIRIASAPYAIAAANVIDGAVTASSLSPGPGADGQVLKMSNGVLTWAADLTSGGTVTSVGTGLGLSGGPITNAGVLSIDPTAVPLLTGNQFFTGSNIFGGVSIGTNANNRFAGAFFGNGAGITNVSASATNPVALSGDVTGSATANTVARIRGVNVLSTAPTAGQHLRFSGTDWGPGLVALGSDVSGTLADARLSGNVALLNTNQVFTASNTFNGVNTMTNANNRFGGTFSGSGAGLTALNAANIASGTLADALLSINVPLLSGNQIFGGSNTFNGVIAMTNANNRMVGTFTGSGANLTTLNAGSVSAGTLADARLSGNVGLLNANQTYAGSNTFSGVSTLTNANNRFAGAFFGNGAGLTNVTASSTNVVTLGGDVTGPAGTNTVARIRGVNVLATAPAAGQHLRFSGTDWGPGLVALGSDVSGTLADARLSGNVALLSTNQTFSGSNTFNGVSTMTNANNRIVGTFTGSGFGLTVLNAGNIALGTLADARLSGNIPLLSGNQTYAGSNTFSGVSTMTNSNNRFAGAFFGNGAGLTNITATSTNAVTLGGDVTGSAATNTVARIRGVNVLATAPVAGQHLRFSGTDWTPSPVALASDVSGTLAVANGGTAASTPAGARASLGTAASGANTDITSLAGLTTPLTAPQGGTGTSAYSPGDLLYASAVNALGRRSIGSTGQVLTVSNALPAWMAANNHNHFGQIWSGVANDGLFVENTSTNNGASGLTGSSTATSGIQYGVFGQTASANGTGVEGFAYATIGNSIGVYGESTAPSGTGVYGLGSALTGLPAGVYGESDAPQGIGVQGYVADSTGPNSGVYGESISTNGNGVTGLASSLAGAPVGVYGKSMAFLGIGVYGLGAATNGGVPVGVYGQVSYTNGYGLYTPNRLYVGQAANVVGNLTAGALTAGSFANSGSNLTNLSASLFSPATNALACATAGAERLRIAADGKVGIGRVATTNIFEVEGNASKTVAGSWLANSDARIKTSVQKIDHALETIGRVRPVSFHYTAEYRAAHPSIEDKQYYNVIAQEFADVFPEAVKQSGETLDGKPLLQVDVHPALITAIAAVQELHGLVKAKDAELARLKEQNSALEYRLQALEQAVANIVR